MIEELKSKAAHHWKTYLPRMWKQLIAEDRLDLTLNQAARAAEKTIWYWMDKGRGWTKRRKLSSRRTLTRNRRSKIQTGSRRRKRRQGKPEYQDKSEFLCRESIKIMAKNRIIH